MMQYPQHDDQVPSLACAGRDRSGLEALKDLRNYMVFCFVVINTLFILIVLMLTLSKDDLYIGWPFGVVENVTMMEATR